VGYSVLLLFIANLLMSLLVKQFWKSFSIWQSCEQEYSG